LRTIAWQQRLLSVRIGVEFPPHNLKPINSNSEVEFHKEFTGNVIQYESIAQSFIDRKYSKNCPSVFRTVFPSWDNTARTGKRALITLNGTPANYEYWLSESIRKTMQDYPGRERFVFINAWNEWAEGCHLEPDRKFGKKFLEATLIAKNNLSQLTGFTDINAPTTISVFGTKRTFFNDFVNLLRFYFFEFYRNIKIFINKQPVLRKILLPVVRTLRYLKIKINV
jgi:lipopolysaccharide biosynthesis protein